MARPGVGGRLVGAGVPAAVELLGGEGYRVSTDRFTIEMGEMLARVKRDLAIYLDKVGLLTLDAHFDMRDTSEGLSNGNPVRALIDGTVPSTTASRAKS